MCQCKSKEGDYYNEIICPLARTTKISSYGCTTLMAKYCSENVYMVRPHKQNPSVGLAKTGVNFHTTFFQELINNDYFVYS